MQITCLQLTTDSKYCVSGSHDTDVGVWDVTSGALIRVLKGHTKRVSFIPDHSITMCVEFFLVNLDFLY